MPRKQSNKQRTKVKDIPKKSNKLSTRDMKKVRGGVTPPPMARNKKGDGSKVDNPADMLSR